MKNVLLIIGFIFVLGLIGRMDCQDAIKTTQIDQQNKQEVIKDIKIRCYTGDLTGDICKGI